MYPEMFVKDAGNVIVMTYDERSGEGLFEDYVIYTIFRFAPHLDFMFFGENELELIRSAGE